MTMNEALSVWHDITVRYKNKRTYVRASERVWTIYKIDNGYQLIVYPQIYSNTWMRMAVIMKNSDGDRITWHEAKRLAK